MNTRCRLLLAGVVLAVCLISVSLLLVQEQQPAAAEELAEIVKRIQPSIVAIRIYDEKGKPISLGSGFFVSQSGHIITNRHVLEGASRAEIKTAQGKIYPVTHILAEDKQGDLVLALVDIPASSVQPLKLSDSVPQVGQPIAIISNPLRTAVTVSDGLVSAVLDIPAFGKVIQVSAPIYPGFSGSPVVDMKGEVIGIATSNIGEDRTRNFAMPIQRAAKLKPGKPRTLAEWQKLPANKKLVSAERDYRKGLVYYRREDYKKALPFFEKAVEKNPNFGEAWFLVGSCHAEFNRHADAVAAYKQAIRSTHTVVVSEVHFNLGVSYDKLGRHAEAITAYKQAIRIRPDDAKAYCNLGVAYLKLGRFDEAIAGFKQAIRIKPDLAKAHYNLGITYANLGRADEAVAAYKQAIHIKPD